MWFVGGFIVDCIGYSAFRVCMVDVACGAVFVAGRLLFWVSFVILWFAIFFDVELFCVGNFWAVPFVCDEFVGFRFFVAGLLLCLGPWVSFDVPFDWCWVCFCPWWIFVDFLSAIFGVDFDCLDDFACAVGLELWFDGWFFGACVVRCGLLSNVMVLMCNSRMMFMFSGRCLIAAALRLEFVGVVCSLLLV